MKKIMFNDRFGLTQAVIEGRKTMTRRFVPNIPCFAYNENGVKKYEGIEDMEIRCGNTLMLKFRGDWHIAPSECQPKYKIGEIVAVAQRYKDIIPLLPADENGVLSGNLAWGAFGLSKQPGYNNKMFVRSDFMPYQIRITDIKIERLQDISEDDCLKEGIYLDYSDSDWDEGDDPAVCYRCTGISEKEFGYPQKAFAYLIDKVSGKGTWDSNPYVFAYSFELVQHGQGTC